MARYKPVPEVRSLDGLSEVRAALPLVPGSVDDCCARLQERADVPTREAAQAWLPFLVALGLAAEQDGSYYRTREEMDRGRLSTEFRDGVYGVPEILGSLESEPLDAEAAFEATRALVPQWERNRDPDWERTWRDRTARVLSWAAVFGLVEEVDGRYRLTD